MKEKLKKMLELLAKRHYSTDTIVRCVLFPTQVEEMEEVLDLFIQMIQETNSERELATAITKIEQKYMEN